MKGGPRRNKPHALRTLHNSRKRPRHAPAVPLTPVATLDAPPGLTEHELQFWGYYMPKLAAVRLLTDVDRDVLADYVRARAQIAEIRTAQQQPRYQRLVTVTAANGKATRTVSNLLDAQLRQWLQIARLAGAELGLSPASRARVAPVSAAQEIDELEAFVQAPLRAVK